MIILAENISEKRHWHDQKVPRRPADIFLAGIA